MKKAGFAVMVVVIAALSFLAGGWYGKERSVSTGSQGERKVLYYVDPMNPGFRSDGPGIAPCGMPLEPVYAETASGPDNGATPMASLSPGAVKISPARQQLIGVKVAAVEKKTATYLLRLYGKVVPDETRVFRVNASTDCWIRELSSVTTGSIVNKDKVLAEALAPAYYNAQLSYVLSLDNIDRIRKQLGGEVRHQQGDLADNQIRMAVQSMQNLGVTDAQIEELARTRKARPYLQVRSPVRGVVLRRNITLNQWFKAGDEFYSIVDIGRVWVYADVYENEARYLRPGMTVKVTHAHMGKTFSAKVSEVLPLFDPVSKTLKVRLNVDNPRYDLRPDMFVDVEIPITMPPSLNVPADAVIDSGTRTIVYVDNGNGVFEPRRVETGWRLGRQVEITAGLMAGEKVVVSGNFLIDSESRMKTAAAGDYGRTVKDPVCGMYVEEAKARMAGRTNDYKGATYYFCSEKCRRHFEKDPMKFAEKGKNGMKEHDYSVLPEMERDHSTMKKDATGPVDRDEHAMHGEGAMKKNSADSANTGASGGKAHDATDMGNKGQDAKSGMTDEQEETREGPYPFPGAKYLGTVEREPAPAEGEPPKDRLRPRQFEMPSAPPIGTRLK